MQAIFSYHSYYDLVKGTYPCREAVSCGHGGPSRAHPAGGAHSPGLPPDASAPCFSDAAMPVGGRTGENGIRAEHGDQEQEWYRCKTSFEKNKTF